MLVTQHIVKSRKLASEAERAATADVDKAIKDLHSFVQAAIDRDEDKELYSVPVVIECVKVSTSHKYNCSYPVLA